MDQIPTSMVAHVVVQTKPTKHGMFEYGVHYGNAGCRVFKRGIQNWKYFYLRINIPKGNYWILSFGLMASCQK